MNRPLTPAELDMLLPTAIPILTKREKLLRFASIIRNAGRDFMIFHDLERMTSAQLARCEHRDSAFAAAAADNILHDAGLSSGTAAEAQRFFELSKDDLHSFSCDCGGSITNEFMADRIEAIANRAA